MSSTSAQKPQSMSPDARVVYVSSAESRVQRANTVLQQQISKVKCRVKLNHAKKQAPRAVAHTLSVYCGEYRRPDATHATRATVLYELMCNDI